MRPRRGAALVAALALLAACGGGGSSRAASTTTARRSTTTAAPATTTTAPTTTTSTIAVPAGCAPVPPRAEPDPHRPRYTVHVTADPDRADVDGDLTVAFTPDVPTDRLVFRLWPNGPRPAAAGVRLTPGTVTSAGQALASSQPDATTLEVALGRMLRAGETVTVSMPWHLVVPGGIDDRFSREGGSLRLGSFVPLLAWEPGVGWAREPATSGFAEAATSPAADWSVSIAAPAGIDVLASGQPVSPGHWQGTGLRDFAFSAGRFDIATGTAHALAPVAVTVGVQRGLGLSAADFLAREIQSLEDLSHRFGSYAWPSLTMAVTPHLEGGIEFPSHIMQGPGTIGRTTPHEAAHQWFYGLVGDDQGRDPWLDEGLASWGEARASGTLDTFRAMAIPADAQGRAGEPMTYWEPRLRSYYRGVYVQPVQALATLGPPELVDCALAHYVAEHAYRIARPADLIAAMEAVFPGAAAKLAPFGLHG